MIVMRVLLGIFMVRSFIADMAAIFTDIDLVWYIPRSSLIDIQLVQKRYACTADTLIRPLRSIDEQQLRFAYLQSGEIIVLATGGIVNYGVCQHFQRRFYADHEQLNHLHGQAGLKGWQWMFLVQGLVRIGPTACANLRYMLT